MLDGSEWKLADRTQLHLLSWLKTPVVMPDGSMTAGSTVNDAYASSMSEVGSRVQSAAYLSGVSTTVATDAERLSRLITELLDASRINAGRLTIHAQPLDLRPQVLPELHVHAGRRFIQKEQDRKSTRLNSSH